LYFQFFWGNLCRPLGTSLVDQQWYCKSASKVYGFTMAQRSLRVGDYEIESEIARGGFGSIYRAVHRPTGKAVAIKVLHHEYLAEHSVSRRFEQEATIVFHLSHPNITQIHEWGKLEDGRAYIAMELLEGQSLDKRLAAAQRLSVEEALGILEPIAIALEMAHAHGIVHRDIKPANIFLAPSRATGRVVLLDFGIAKLVAGDGPILTTSRASLGTIPFMAPEQIRGEPVDARADVYALAAVAYMMFTGSPPFGTQTTSVLRQIHLHTRPSRPSTRAPIDPLLDEPILRALSTESRQRPASAREFVTALRTCLPQQITQQSLPCGVLERSTIAVHAEIRIGAERAAYDDEAVLEAMDTSLRMVSAELTAVGLVIVRESRKMLLAVSPDPPNEPLMSAVHSACIRAYRRFNTAMMFQRYVELGIFIHCGSLHTNDSGTLLPSGLLDAAAWSPAATSGVAASRCAFADRYAGKEAVAGSFEFFWIERS